jgi:hypothetical protein
MESERISNGFARLLIELLVKKRRAEDHLIDPNARHPSRNVGSFAV